MAYKFIGNTTVEWNDTKPFNFTMSEATGPTDERGSKTITMDLSELRQGFEDDFLLHLKDHLIQRRYKVTLRTIETECSYLRCFFRKVIELNLCDFKISVIDESFLLALGAVKEVVANLQLKYLKMAFVANPDAPIFATGLHRSDFPEQEDFKGKRGRQIDRILVKALTRAACVHILGRCEQAYDIGEMDIGHFSFANLAFAVFCRPDSYRQIRLDDLVLDRESKTFFLYIIPVKTRSHKPAKICYQINEALGVLLQKQRQHIVANYGHLVAPEEVGKLALFPSRRIREDKTGWTTGFANQNFGMCEKSGSFINAYPKAIQYMFLDSKFNLNANVLRHTLGTQLAHTGASAKTIQAVLRHATDTVCQAYVDIAFEGLINELSDTMAPAFQRHLPAINRFRSKSEPIPIDKAIRSDDLETGQIELTGECGKQIQCEHGPIICYGCPRFIPCWDADHSVNLSVVQREIDDFNQRGKPFQHMVERAREAKYRIIFVMNAADLYRQSMTEDALS
jgi:integrase